MVVLLQIVYGVDTQALKEYYSFSNNLIVNNGLRTAVSVLKALNTTIRKSSLGQIQKIGTLAGIWFDCYKDTGIPKSMPALSKLIKSHPQAAIQIGNLYTVFRLEPEINLTTVESLYTGTLSEVELSEYRDWCKEFVSPIQPFDWSEYKIHFSLNAGPNNKVSLTSVLEDLLALSANPELESLFLDLCTKSGHKVLAEMYKQFKSDATDLGLNPGEKVEEYVNAKLAFLSDKGGKTRIIYIMSWWWQELLHPLHQQTMNWLSKQPQDATYRQREVALLIKEWTKQGKPVWAFDLTAATDRWPVWHQRIAIASLLGEDLAEVWYQSLTKVKPFVKDIGRYTSYEVGQPMGAYASWSALSVNHHLTMRFLAHKVGVKPEYYVLGDDLIILNDKLASAYLAYMDKLGVDISLQKSYTQEQQKLGTSAEFAKYLFHNGIEYTPLSPILLQEIYTHHQWWKVVDLMKWMRDTHGHTPVVNGESDSEIQFSTATLKLISLLPEGDQSKVVTLLSHPDMVKELKSLNPTKTEYVGVPNPWKGAGDSIALKVLQMDLIVTRLQETYSTLLNLKLALKGEGTKTTPNLGLESPNHPIWKIVDDLDKAILTTGRQISGGDTPKEAINLLTDVKLLHQILVLGKGVEGWERNNRSRFLNQRDHLVLTLNKRYNDLDSWYYDEI